MSQDDGQGPQRMLPLVVGALGVVFGDIGTSPLYTLKEAFGPHYGLAPDQGNVLGILSLIVWSLLLVVTVKYVMIIMRADNKGEGGILALMALVQRSLPIASPLAYGLGVLGIFGTALFFGDGVITPAISVLGAVEGLEIAAPGLTKYVVPISLVILIALFSMQRFGTDKVGRIFGPITIAWFLVIAGLGAVQIVANPGVMRALNPYWAVHFFFVHGVAAWLALGAVVLAVTGGEALYADMGHFGRGPIRIGWMAMVLPALVINYLGQGALILAQPTAVENPFFLLVPEALLYPMIVLATLAAVIASQALISGTFSVVREAIQLGYLPRMTVIHTSSQTRGQIYLPAINRALLVAVMIVVLSFGSSSSLAAAYGVSVTGTMLISGTLMLTIVRIRWGLSDWIVLPVAAVLLGIDVAFLSSNLSKFLDGAWLPLALGVASFTLMRTWRRGRDLVREHINRDSLRIEHFVQSVMLDPPHRVDSTAVFLTPSNDYLPPALLHNLKHNQVLHATNVILSVQTLDVPRAGDADRVAFQELGYGFSRMSLRFGYMEDPNVPAALKRWATPELPFDPMSTTFFASRESLAASADQGMALWRDKLFLLMSRNATPATEYFSIPADRLVELGTKVII